MQEKSTNHTLNSILEKGEFLLLSCFITLLPMNFTWILAPTNILIMLWALIWLVRQLSFEKFREIQKRRLLILFISVYLINIVGLLNTSDMSDGLFKLESRLSLFIFPLILSTAKYTHKQVLLLFRLYTTSCFLVVIYGIILGFYWSQIDPPHWVPKYIIYVNKWHFYHHTFSNFINFHASYWSYFLIMGILVCFYLLQNTRSRIFPATAIFASIIIIVLLSVRTIILSLLFIIPLYIILSIKKRKGYLLKLVLGGLGVIICIGIILYISPDVRHRITTFFPKDQNYKVDETKVSNTRSGIWYCSWQILQENIITGVGTGDIKQELMASFKKNNFTLGIEKEYNNPHNQYLDYWLAFGVLGLIVLLLALGTPLVDSVRNKNYFYLCYLLFVAIIISTECILNSYKGIQFYGFFNAFLAFSEDAYHGRKNINS